LTSTAASSPSGSPRARPEGARGAVSRRATRGQLAARMIVPSDRGRLRVERRLSTRSSARAPVLSAPYVTAGTSGERGGPAGAQDGGHRWNPHGEPGRGP